MSNEHLVIKFKKIRDVKTPSRGTENSAGFDFYTPNGIEKTWLLPGQKMLIPSGIKMIIPDGWCGTFFNKSSHGSNGILVGAQVVDSDYRGEVHLNIHNVSHDPFEITPGKKLIQMLLMPSPSGHFLEVSDSEFDRAVTQRGSGGFGSTGA